MDLRIRLTPEQEARRAALVERLHKLGTMPSDRAELLLEALAALVEQKEGPRGPLRPPVQVHVHQCPGCGRTRFLEVHHLKPRNLGGTNDPANLVTLCSACHRLTHSRDLTLPPAPVTDKVTPHTSP